ncbi:MAG: type VI secretion system membrane subunit TssM [Ignavibacteriales bacterium]|nr:type VI secretion system membrane subunit TssM [Ignavibacteriales bacterium]
MDSIIKILRSRNVIVALVIILLLAIAYFGGSIFGMSMVFRIGIGIFFIMVVIIFLLYNRMKEVQKAGKIEQSINASADANMQNLSPEKKAEIEQFKKQLEAAITSLKNSKIGKGKTGKAALYALPWYMIIGPSAAGKTTAIQNSGLEFPFGKEGFRGVGGTRNCDWFFSTKGIFLDTAGRYISQTEDRSEWLAFLDVLKKNRRKKPINGVIIALNVDEIINADKEQLNEHASNMRQRIDELIQNLGVNFPVYFIFTKCDLIQGFVEYFGDFSEIERSQIWGATFPSEQLNQNVKDLFEIEFNKLTEKLFEIRTIRLSGPLKREQRRKVFLFPFQYKSLQQKLTHLISEVFQHNPYQDNPIFRGFYFTSGTQEGVPLDLAIKQIAKQFNLPEPTKESTEDAEEIVETKNYFIKDLLNDVVIGDQNYIAGQTSGFTKKLNTLKLVVVISSILFLSLFSLFTYVGFSGSTNALDKISSTANTFKSINWNGNLLTNFKETENLRSTIENIENGNAVESFVSFGMDRSDRTKKLLENLYITKTEYFFNENIFKEIERVLNIFANGQDYSGEDIYNYLKAYMLLGNERIKLDTTEHKFLVNVFSKILESHYINPNTLASSTDKDSLKHLFRNYISFIVKRLNDKAVYPERNDNVLISLVRSRIQYQPNAENLYARLKQKGTNQFSNDLTLEQVIGGRFSSLMKTDLKIPHIFTADGWKNYMQEAIINESKNPGQEDWVMGDQQIKPTKELNSEDVRNELLLMYLNDYKQAWVQFLQSIQFGDFESVPLAANSLKILSDPVGSPLVLILKTFATQLQVIVDIQSPQDTTQNKKNSANSGSTNPNLAEINKYRKLILAPDGSASNDLNAIIAQYGNIGGVIESIKDAQDLTKDYAVKVLSQRAVELPTALQSIKGALFSTPALQGLFTDPVKLTWRAILSDASLYINEQWKTKVYDVFNKTMANSFPFKKSNNDVPIQDFKDFFKPQGGILWSFFNDELSSFINKERWKVNLWENEGINISNELLAAYKRADDISATLFKSGDLNISFKLKPQLPDSKPIVTPKPVVEQVYLNLDNVENYYKMGASFWTDYSWPGSKGTPTAKMNISIRGYGTSDSKAYDGEWSLFRLLNEASASIGESSSQYIFNWFFRKENSYDVVVTYLLNAGSSRNPFSASFFKSFNLPYKID